MKIIKRGISDRQLYRKHCNACNSLLEFDKPDLNSTFCYTNGTFCYTLRCPHCNHEMIIYPSDLKQYKYNPK